MSWQQLLLAILGPALSAVIPVLVSWVQKLLPVPKPAPTASVEDKSKYRATVRQWVGDMLVEFGNVLIAKNIVPVWLQPEVALVEQMAANAIDAALDAAGL